MESNWRFNVADAGWAFSGMDLYARLLHPFSVFQNVYKNAPGGASKSLGTDLVFPDGSMQIATFHISTPLNFPYGIEVYPD